MNNFTCFKPFSTLRRGDGLQVQGSVGLGNSSIAFGEGTPELYSCDFGTSSLVISHGLTASTKFKIYTKLFVNTEFFRVTSRASRRRF